MKFKIGDKVSIKGKNYYGSEKKWIVTYIYKNSDMVLRNENDEEETIERYDSNELKKR